MNPLFLTNLLLESEHKYGFLGIDAPPEIADFVLEWGKLNVPDDVLAADGREDDIHVTVKYGLTVPRVNDALLKIVHDTPEFPVMIGKISLFTTSPDFDVVKLEIESPELRRLNKRVSDSLPNEDKYPEYTPHMTVAYVEKGSCEHLDGEDPFASGDVEREFVATRMTFRGAGEEEAQEHQELEFNKTQSVARDKAMTEGVDSDDFDVQTYIDDLSVKYVLFNSKFKVWLRMSHARYTSGYGAPPTFGVWTKDPNKALKFETEKQAECEKRYWGNAVVKSVIESENPFDGIGFPSDSGEMARFLARIRRHRPVRQVL